MRVNKISNEENVVVVIVSVLNRSFFDRKIIFKENPEKMKWNVTN